ncbi:lytic murein transglycosylase [Caenimonas sedimenti]|uniref:Lytic murein transglycosylase n=1 Tax=Caenimonas sedimenti TaxID=2596921 RepID=A0A562ZYB4_9BURK|nr:lytic murein transglycosylase [Caenimonas sedimenti]TWO73416.1 lytic murein transglycosylase [Caenimonas sedimenti]
MQFNPTVIARCAAAALIALQVSISQAGPLDQPMSDAQFAACVQGLAGQTAGAGRPIKADDFTRIASQARYDDRVRQALLVQRGEPTFWWDDIAATTDDERVAQGREVLVREADALQRIEARWGVPKEVVVAIYGIETNYGPSSGRIPVLDAALSLACLRPCTTGNCASRERAYAAVRLLRDGKVRGDNYQGSWAAAFGRTQFVPDTFEQIAVDFDGDGVADIVGSERDAFASTANHLQKRGGWIAGAPAYVEVRIPQEQQREYAAATGKVKGRDRKVSEWAAQGWQAVGAGGEAVPLQATGDPMATPFLPVGLPGPAFLVTRNFDTIWRYNNSDRYVMEVAVLANRLAGGPGIVTAWPTDDPGLSRAQVRELQAWLLQRGHTLVTPDGVAGRNTRDAIEAERTRKGLPPGRRAGQRTMRLLMQP